MQAVEGWAQAAQESGFTQNQDDGPDVSALSKAVQELLDQETSFAEQNAKRMNLVRLALRKPAFAASVAIVDILISPLDVPMNKCLKRSSMLKALQFQRSISSLDRAEMERHCQNMFLDWCSGHLGALVIKDFLSRLQSAELTDLCRSLDDDGTALSQTTFQLILFGMSDSWRRLCLSVSSFPHKLFSLVKSDPGNFINSWNDFRRTAQRCQGCVDAAFSGPLLKSVDFTGLGHEAQKSQVTDLQRLLQDVATFCPLATDSVENLHGQHQSMVFAFRGGSKRKNRAAESSVLHSLKTEHAHIKAVIEEGTLPTRCTISSMTRNLTRKRGTVVGATAEARIRLAAKRKPKRLCGWNVFQRERLQRTPLAKAHYKDSVQQLGKEWQRLPAESKSEYALKAEYEQSCREELQTRPLPYGQHKRRLDEDPCVSGNPMKTDQLEHIAGPARAALHNFKFYH